MRVYKLTLPVAAFLVGTAWTISSTMPLQPESKVWVNGSSTVRDWKCDAKTINSAITAGGPNTAALDLTALVSSAEVSVPVTALECGNNTMNDHMRKALKASTSPDLQFKLGSYTVQDEVLTLNGTLTIAGKAQPVEFTGKVQDANGVVRATATRQINMTEWGVKPPSLMMGTMKVKDAVTIGFDVLIKR